jgi:hypothetical protein
MKHVSSYNSKKWKVLIESSNEPEYTIDTRHNYVYKPVNDFWKYQKKGTSTWEWVENEESISKLNSKYKLDLGVYKPKGFTKYKIDSRSSYYYKVDPSNKHWQYYKINSTSINWNLVENEESVRKLNNKYKKKLIVYKQRDSKLAFNNEKERRNFKMAKLYISQNNSNQKDVILALKKACKTVGFNENITAAIIGNVGRENGFHWNKIIKPHLDPKNSKTNIGIISWQQTRKTNLISKLKTAGLYKNGKISGSIDDIVYEMVDFMKDEMSNEKSRFKGTYDKLKNSNSTKEASDILKKYIGYAMGSYNRSDPYFNAWKNHMWAKAAMDNGLINYSYLD